MSPASHDGWDIHVELDGRILATEHCSDWHRVERRRALLEAQFAEAAVNRVRAAPADARLVRVDVDANPIVDVLSDVRTEISPG
jgi:hypothetical protein